MGDKCKACGGTGWLARGFAGTSRCLACCPSLPLIMPGREELSLREHLRRVSSPEQFLHYRRAARIAVYYLAEKCGRNQGCGHTDDHFKAALDDLAADDPIERRRPEGGTGR
jgi:hypothetical protein